MLRFVRIIFFIYCFIFSKQNFSQDIRAAWIEYKWLSGYTYSITLTLHTEDISNPDSHCSATIYFGNGDSCVAIRENGVLAPSSAQCPTSYMGVFISTTPIAIKKSIYSCIYTYSGPGMYKVFSNEKFRVTGEKNLANSLTKSVYVQSYININSFFGPNSTVNLMNPPTGSVTISGNQILYNPAAYNPDGDSISYQLINCSYTPSTTTYYIPNTASVSPTVGILSFSKDSIGLYAFAYLIQEWRKDSGGNPNLVGYMKYDFVLDIFNGVGIKEFEEPKAFSLYPNPASNTLTIKTNQKINSDIQITNSLGEILLKQPYSETIDVSKLNPGYYFIKVDNSYSKFIKE